MTTFKEAAQRHIDAVEKHKQFLLEEIQIKQKVVPHYYKWN